jgi:drug/metabolite transporter (DMT)-like permease
MNRTAVGIVLAAATAVISGIAVFINSFAVKEVSDPALFTTLKNGFACLVLFGAAMAVPAQRRRLPTDRRSVTGITFVGILGGGVAFLLFFTGLSMASAPSAAFIHKTLFVWVALLAVPLLGERLGWMQMAAIATLLGGQMLIAPPTGVTWGAGETMIAAATLLWAVEVVVARRLLRSMDPFVLGVSRLGIGLLMLIGYLVITGKLSLLAGLTGTQWSWVVLTGLVLAAYVGTWFSALARAPATVVASVLVLAAPITAVLDGLVRGTLPAAAPLSGYALIVAAVAALIVVAARRRGGAQAELATT